MSCVVPNFCNARVLVIGDVMLDQYCLGATDHISSEAPVPIVRINSVKNYPGGAANVAVNVASLGGETNLVGFVGKDHNANVLRNFLNDVKVNSDLFTIPTHSTILKLRVLSRNQQLIRLDFEKNFNDVDLSLLLNHVKLILPSFKVLVLSDYSKGVLNRIEEIIILAQDLGIPILVDPVSNDFSRYKGVTLLTPNLLEFKSVAVNYCKNESSLLKAGMDIIDDYLLSAILITESEQGMTLLQKNHDPIHFPSFANEVYDVVGAGDTVIGVVAAALSSGENLENACFLANVAAGIVVGKAGTSSVTVLELEAAVYDISHVKFGIIDEIELKKSINIVRQRGEKIVMTNGVFDIIHPGHISYLQSAKKLGNRLIVAVNSDDSTVRLKGKGRPVNSLIQRMTVLAALKVVDWVVPFYEDTPQRIVSNLLPDILVKGGDYKIHEIEGSNEVLANGGEVRILEFYNSFSTSEIINNIKG